MSIILDDELWLENAVENSTYVILFQLKDEDGETCIPNSAVWSLRNSALTIINGRSAVSIISPATTNNIILSGTDLSCLSGVSRILTITGTYTSTYGIDLPFTEEYNFLIKDLKGIVNA